MSKNSTLDKAKAHFSEAISGEMKEYYVEEWDTTIYYKKGTNFAQEAKVIELQNQGKTAEALVQVLINRALDENGKRIFADAEKAVLMNSVDPAVILKVVGEINSGEAPSLDDALGN